MSYSQTCPPDEKRSSLRAGISPVFSPPHPTSLHLLQHLTHLPLCAWLGGFFTQAFFLTPAQTFLSNGQIPSSVPILFSVLLRPPSQKHLHLENPFNNSRLHTWQFFLLSAVLPLASINVILFALLLFLSIYNFYFIVTP